MPQQLEYDERGATFYYFLVSFYGLILLPATYFLWPYKRKGEFQSNLGSTRTQIRQNRSAYHVLEGVWSATYLWVNPLLPPLDVSQQKLVCQCDPCRHKRVRLEEERPKETLKTIAK